MSDTSWSPGTWRLTTRNGSSEWDVCQQSATDPTWYAVSGSVVERCEGLTGTWQKVSDRWTGRLRQYNSDPPEPPPPSAETTPAQSPQDAPGDDDWSDGEESIDPATGAAARAAPRRPRPRRGPLVRRPSLARLTTLEDLLQAVAGTVEDSLLQSGAVPGRDYQPLDLMQAALPIVCEMIRLAPPGTYTVAVGRPRCPSADADEAGQDESGS